MIPRLLLYRCCCDTVACGDFVVVVVVHIGVRCSVVTLRCAVVDGFVACCTVVCYRLVVAGRLIYVAVVDRVAVVAVR